GLAAHTVEKIAEAFDIGVVERRIYFIENTNWRRLRGVTGDCFGATNQLVEVFVYTVGAASSTGRWHEEF
ncbi:MAG: adenosylcobinamide-GDP ribazoletransferase, partial [Acidobacteria bacterium]|nr:adenosylcobinamide-GDP ribazoletransferase [Acidobacteriota bacterium]